MSVERPQLCEDCGAPTDRAQRYCLACGARAGSRSPQLEELMRRVGGRSQPAAASPASPGAVGVAPQAAAGASAGLRLPPPRISALLVLVFLGFGVLLGNTAGSRVPDTLASSRSPVKLVLAPRSAPEPTASASNSQGTAEASSSPSEVESPPASEAEATPAPAPKASPAPAAAPSGSGGGSSNAKSESPKSNAGAATLPSFKHVFVIMLSDEPYASLFGPASTAPYLSQTLEHQGDLLVRYDAVAHEELANEVALLSGQGPTLETAANCPNYTAIAPTGIGADGQVLGNGCVYPASTQTLVGQLTAKHLTWRAYIQGIDEAGTAQSACAHPVLGQADPTAVQSASTGPYATFRNPFVYFDSVLESPACEADDVGLDRLKTDLADAKRTPSFSYIVPDRCDDGNPTPCTPGVASAVAPADTFLKQVVPQIMASKAYKQAGLLVITGDEAPSSGEFADSSSCCGQPLFPNAPSTTVTGAPRGGGAVGALLLSPYVKGGTTSEEAYNHFSLLRTIEDVFGLAPLGYAGLAAVKPFEASMFSAPAPAKG